MNEAETKMELLKTYMWYWASAAERQCIRALDITDGDQASRLFDAFLAINATYKAVLAAERVCKELGSKGLHWGTYKEFKRTHPHLKNARDISEHFDAYILGEGNLQSANKKNPAITEPFTVRYDEEKGSLRLELVKGRSFTISLSELSSDIMHLLIDLTCDFDALEDEAHLFEP
jgi:hypothetical protein